MDAPLKARFKDLSTYDMKDLLLQRMFQTDHHKEHEEHQQLYMSLERSMKIDDADELEKELAEERKRKKRKQSIPKPPSEDPPHPPPPPPPSGSGGAPGSSGGASTFQSMQPPHVPQSSPQKGLPESTTESRNPKSSQQVTYKAWTTTETRHTPSVSVEHDLDYDSGLPIKDPSSAEEEDDDNDDTIPQAHKRDQWWKSFTRSDGSPSSPVTVNDDVISTWWKHDEAVQESLSPEPEWMITSDTQSVPNNNWAHAVADNYVPPPTNSLLAQTGDMGSFI